MAYVLILLLLFILLIVFAGVGLFIFYLYQKIKRKGYEPPVATLLTVLSVGIGISAAIIFLSSDNTTIFIFIDIAVPLLLSALLMTIIALLIPQKNVRKFGERKTKLSFIILGRAVIVTGILLILYAIYRWIMYGWQSSHFIETGSVVLMVLIPLSGYFFYLEKRKNAYSMTAVLANSKKPSVLYLRSFNQESQYFVVGAKEKYGSFTHSWSSLMAQDYQNIGVTTEEFLTGEISQSIGPFVALGSPEDYLPPEGAARMYADDKNWMNIFKELSKSVACIIMEVGKSDNLSWELKELKKDALEEKLFVLTRPSALRQNYLTRKFLALIWRMKGIEAITWIKFAEELNAIGYNIDLADPGFGSVVTFDSAGKSILLTTNAEMPLDYITPIKQWMLKS
ncbi:MAG: hypothetical protein ABI921_03905 [Panacibacter sp.]